MPPRPEVDLVDRDGLSERAGPLPPLHPVAVAPVVAQVGHDARQPGAPAPARRWRLHREGVRVRLVKGAALREDPVLVPCAGLGAVHEPAPQAAPAPLERVRVRVPVVEVAHDRDAVGVRGPDGEPGAPAFGVGAEVPVAVGKLAVVPGAGGFLVDHGEGEMQRRAVGPGVLAEVPRPSRQHALFRRSLALPG